MRAPLLVSFALVLALAATLSSCVSTRPLDPVAQLASHSVLLDVVLVNGAKTHCSGTIVSHKAILSASHCFAVGQVSTLSVNGQELEVIGVLDDDRDHTLLLFADQTFRSWARVYLRPLVQGEDVQIYGNPGQLRAVYRRGYVSASVADLALPGFVADLLDLPGYGGDSGGGVFDRSGNLVGMVSFVNSQARSNATTLLLIQFVGVLPFDFSPVEWQVAGVSTN